MTDSTGNPMNNPEAIKALVAKWRATNCHTEAQDRVYRVCADELESLTAVAGGAEVVARELFADVLESEGYYISKQIRDGNVPTYEQTVIRAIVRALNTRQAVEGMVEYEFEVWQGDEMQAGGTTATLESAQVEASHYALMYGQDATVELKFYERRAIAAAAPRARKGDNHD